MGYLFKKYKQKNQIFNIKIKYKFDKKIFLSCENRVEKGRERAYNAE